MPTLPHVNNSNPFDDWRIIANGHRGSLHLNLNPAGDITGSAFGDPIIGYWNAQDGMLTFMRLSVPVQVYTGYLFDRNFLANDEITGFFQAFPGDGAQAKQNVFGWQAEA